jgi:hypothetical protein
MFASKLKRLSVDGATVVLLKEPGQLDDEPHDALLIDLARDDGLRTAVKWLDRTGRPVAAFAPHVETDSIRQARTAGVAVWTRSQVATLAPGWIAKIAAQGPTTIGR